MTDLHLFNSMTKSKEPFAPIDKKQVTMYACGPTVYNYIHIGNGRMTVVFDLLYRVLKSQYKKVIYARNLTDVDDKIIDAAQKEGKPTSYITETYIKAFHDDCGSLQCLTPDHEPKCTEYIDKMIVMIEQLVENGHAYEAEGHVLFHVPSYDDYGKLSNRSRDEQIAGARVEVAPYKQDPADFVLWKPSTEEQPGWDSPWGVGRPGWHLECSVMSTDLLGETFDIHGGGQDLKFPHHENEIAQSCCAHKKSEFAKIWMHNGFLTIEGEKMSKSLGNFYTVREIVEKYPGEAVRMVLLSAHYRQPLDFSFDQLGEAKGTLDRWYGALDRVADIKPSKNASADEVTKALNDDLNTPKAYAALHKLFSTLNKAESDKEKATLKGEILAAGNLLGLLQHDPAQWLRGSESINEDELDEIAIEKLISERERARFEKDFARADEIRDQLEDAGVMLEDSDGKTSWRRRRA